ncbi:DUF1450 domain-containing protein [Saccharibacillus sp. CPCC 101409]|uniref:DUF1450 domain-containing protein n=1 Tax=Saccharibacillus sp. CPCC 101409 TaxID=3058041 RepID=UPI0026711CAF|nr:DUF1450 domain-containing protein [Saccharibacillus sp. CPCC 101409]MDO3411908.1 DUF1450 domain-containing protein [Saccharibacillus sp. CPCC 101409]
MKIKFCEKNLDRFSKPAYKALKGRHDDVKLKKESCLKECRLCRAEPFAIVKGEIVRADTPKKLVKKLEKAIEQKGKK